MSETTSPQQGAGSKPAGQPAQQQQQGMGQAPKPQQQGGSVIRDWASI